MVCDVVCTGDASELPIGDGSAKLFVDAINKAGVVETGGAREPVRVTETIELATDDGRSTLVIEPIEGPADAPPLQLFL